MIFIQTQAPVPSLTAEEWISGHNASPKLMSLKVGSRIRTHIPIVSNPKENVIAVSDKNNDRKFMFLSEETQPDYRPLDVRLKESNKPCPRIDHRPLGADSYSNSPESIKNIKINQPKRNENNSTSCNNKKDDLGSKFQDVQRKWMLSPASMGESDSSDLDLDLKNHLSGQNSLPLGHTSVKSLSNKFKQDDGQNGSQNGQEITQMFEEQQRTIENLEAQVTSKDRKIQQLEDQIKQLSLPLKSESFSTQK